MTATRVRIHKYMWMVLGLSTKGKLIVTMTKHIQRILDTSPTEMYGSADNPAANHMFHVREDVRYMSV